MHDDLRDFGGLYAALQGAIEVKRQLDSLVARNQCGQRDDAAVTRIKAGTLPGLAEQTAAALGVASWTRDVDALLSNPEVEAVVIGSPAAYHVEIIVAAAQARKLGR